MAAAGCFHRAGVLCPGLVVLWKTGCNPASFSSPSCDCLSCLDTDTPADLLPDVSHDSERQRCTIHNHPGHLDGRVDTNRPCNILTNALLSGHLYCPGSVDRAKEHFYRHAVLHANRLPHPQTDLDAYAEPHAPPNLYRLPHPHAASDDHPPAHTHSDSHMDFLAHAHTGHALADPDRLSHPYTESHSDSLTYSHNHAHTHSHTVKA